MDIKAKPNELVEESVENVNSKQTKRKSKTKKIKLEADCGQQVSSSEITALAVVDSKRTQNIQKVKQDKSETPGMSKTSSHTPQKKRPNKKIQPVQSVKKIKENPNDIQCSPGTSKQGDTGSVTDDDYGSEHDILDKSVIAHENLPDYASKFGIERIKLDRFKLDVPHTNLQYVAIDEICLEGLDGITIEALWTRISVAIKQPQPLPDSITNFIWNTVKSRKDIEFYLLQHPRPKLIIFDRYQNSDPDIGAAMDPMEAPLDIYPYHPVKDKEVLGSASSFETRVNIIDDVRKLTLVEAELRYGTRLVMVGSQKLRAKAIMNPQADPTIEFTPAQYCLLERIGRSRKLGETTQGKVSLQIISKDPKIIFYTRKILGENRLISKQPFYMKSPSANHLSGSLLHLKRFYNEKKTKTQIMTEQIVEVLRTKPGHRMEYSETKIVFGNPVALNKLFKLPEFQKFVRTDVQVRFRELYPNAAVKEWKLKGNSKERKIRTIELVNPNVNIGGTWNEEEPKEESSDEDETLEIIYNSPMLHQVYNFIRAGGPAGRTLKEVQANKGLDFYSIRAAVNQLVNQNLIVGVKIDMGRQRMIKYHTCHYHSNDTDEASLSENQAAETRQLEKDSLEFLSDLLEIEPEFLKPDPYSHEELNVHTSSSSGSYALIRQLRQQNKQSKDEPIKSKVIETKFLPEKAPLKFETLDFDREHSSTEVIDASQRDFNSSLLEKIFKNQHGYNTLCSNSLINENENDQMNSENSLKVACRNICHSSNLLSFRTKKKKKIHRKLFLKSKQANILDLKKSPTVEDVLKTVVCPLIFPSKNLSASLQYRRLCSKVTKIVKPILQHFRYKIKILLPKKRYMCKSKLPNDKMALFSKDHPLLSLAVDSSKQTLKRGMFDKLELKRTADFDENQDVKRIRLDESSVSVNESPVVGVSNTYMGPNPRVAFYEADDEGIETTVLVSTKPEEFDEPGSKYIKDNNATLRTLKRAHCILEAVSQEKIITDVRRLHRKIEAQDKEEGYNVKVDKKSLERIYTRLVRGGHIQVLQIILKANDMKRSVTVLSDPSTDVHHSVIESVIEQLKMKFFVTARKKDIPIQPTTETNTAFDTCEITGSVGELRQLSINDSSFLYNRSIGKDYGHSPKFMRMRVLHEFLFHLIYNYPHDQEVNNVAEMFKELEVAVEDDVINEMPRVYCKEISWKMFVPPLTKHSGWPEGWALVCDVLLRLPLSLFVKLYNVSYVIPELPMYLEHPVKQFYLVKHLPPEIRNGILHRRKYIFSIHETFARLCYIGLLQFGPQKLREKDQLFIYLNRNATLLDTTTSNAGYHYVEDKEYKKIHYHFATTVDVETYWYEMWNICAHSKLGLRNTVTGTYITIEQVDTKPAMIEAMKPRTPESALLNDDGHIPGDGRGAGGLDSALWSHIKRNWIWCSHIAKLQPEKPATEANSKKYKLKTKRSAAKLKSKDADLEGNPNPVAESQRRVQKKTNQTKKSQPIKRGKSYIRKVLPRVDLKKKKDYDSIDKKLMENLKQSRSEWYESEDKVLQIFKIVATFLCPNYRKQSIAYTVMRDVLHKLSPCSTNKTSGACHRRLAVIFGSAEQQEYLQHIVRTLHHIPYVRKYFQKFSDLVDAGTNLSDKQLNGAFVFLVTYFFKHQHEVQHIFEAIAYKSQVDHKSKTKPTDKTEAALANLSKIEADSLLSQQIKAHHQRPMEIIAYECVELTNQKSKNNKLYSQAATFPQTETDVILDTIKSIIHSTIGSRQDEISWLYQLFRVYQNYSDGLLKSALTEIRNSQMIALKRTFTKKHSDLEGLPITTKFFQFSFYYYFAQITKFPPELFHEAHEIFLGIVKHKDSLINSTGNGLPMESFEQGHAVGLAEIAFDINTYFSMDIPKEVLILNPKIADHSELIRELAIRYNKMLTLVKEGTYFKDDDNEDNERESMQNDNLDAAEEVNLPKQAKLIPRTPMIQRFLKSWFLADEFDEGNEDGEDNNKSQTVPGDNKEIHTHFVAVPASDGVTVSEDLDKKSGVKLEKKKKRPNQMTSEESKKILESLNPQLQLTKQESQTTSSKVREKSAQGVTEDMTLEKRPELQVIPFTENMSDLSFEDYEKKLETLLGGKVTETYVLPLKISVKESQGDLDVIPNENTEDILVDASEESNILEKYLDSKRHLTIITPADANASDCKQSRYVKISKMQENETNTGNTDSDPITNARIQYLMDDELTVEQIMTEMLVECPEEDRKVPKAINLARLLVKGLFPELDEDEERLERLHQHFLIICPDTNLSLSDFDSNEELKYIYLEHPQTCKQLLRKVQMDIIVNENVPTNIELSSKLRSLGSTDLDIFIAESLIDFVFKKRVTGASINQLKDHFSNLENIKLSTLLQTLTNMNLLVRVGIAYIVYVHHKHKKHWLVESCTLEDQDRLKLKESKAEDPGNVDVPTLAKSLDSYTEIKVRIMPWARIDGTINLKVFEKWMYTVLGYCLSDMLVPLTSLFRSCSFLKPVEVYYLVECLQELGCVQMVAYKPNKCTLFSEPMYTEAVDAEITDAFEDIYIETNRLAVIKLGTLLNKKLKEFDFPSDETKKYGTF